MVRLPGKRDMARTSWQRAQRGKHIGLSRCQRLLHRHLHQRLQNLLIAGAQTLGRLLHDGRHQLNALSLVDQVGDVITDVRAICLIGVLLRPRLNPVYGLAQLFGIRGKVLRGTPAHGENTGARAGLEAAVQMADGGLSGLLEFARLHLRIVEKIGDVAVRQRGFCSRIRSRHRRYIG